MKYPTDLRLRLSRMLDEYYTFPTPEKNELIIKYLKDLNKREIKNDRNP